MTDSKMNDTPSFSDFDKSTCCFGKVKWFNNKAGYGFCTVIGDDGGDRVGEDIFAHHTGVKVDSEQYKYLVQGEYVQFTLRESDSGSHPYQAAELSGPWGGSLMCETRNEQRQQRSDREGEDGGQHDSRSTRPSRDTRGGRTVRLQGAGPREGETWTLVKDNTSRPKRGRREKQSDA